jgi:hypothetical protein
MGTATRTDGLLLASELALRLLERQREAGEGPRELAERLGVSRSRAYQIAEGSGCSAELYVRLAVEAGEEHRRGTAAEFARALRG